MILNGVNATSWGGGVNRLQADCLLLRPNGPHTDSMELLERQPSLDELARFAREARDGQGRLVLVAGEAGVGKTALIERFQQDLPEACWSWGACDGLFTPRPLGPLFDLAQQLGGDLARLCAGSAGREELFGGLLRQISDPDLLNVVVVEDVHWADEATTDMLRFLGRRLRDRHVLLIATYRDESLAAGHPLLVALGDLAGISSTRRMTLAPLSEDAVRQLAGPSKLDAAELYQLTGGNPFFVAEAVQAGIARVPVAARDAVLARAARLSAPARDLLDVAALTGSRIEPVLIETVSPGSSALVDELLSSGLLIEDGRRLTFRHEIARLAAERAIPAHRRVGIHTRILAALIGLGCTDDARLAFHAEEAGDVPAVLRYATAAARRAGRLASHREAAAQYERALRCAEDLEPATAAALYDGLAGETALIDRWEDAGQAQAKALDLWRQAGNTLREGDTMRRLSRTMWRLCRGQEARTAAESALHALEPLGPTPELAWALAGLAAQRMMDTENAAAIELAQRAQQLARTLGVPEVLSDALNTEGCARDATDADGGVGKLHEALQIALAGGLEEQAGRAYGNLHASLCARRMYAEADPWFTEGVAYCDEHDVTTFSSCLRGERTWSLTMTGRWDDAASLSTCLLDEGVPSPVNRINPLTSLGLLRARRAEAGAWACLDEAAEAADATEEGPWILHVRLARAEARWLDGQTELARAEAEQADDVAEGGDSWERGAVAVWLRRCGSLRPIRGELAEPFQREIEGYPEKAAQLWTDLGCHYEAALARYHAAGEQPLREALTIFTELGAPAAARITRRKMRELGIRSIPAGPRSATRADPLGLTPREHEVLEMICAGHTNVEIASQLFISAKTVDHHVSAVLAKVGAPTRGAAASVAARLGLTSQGAVRPAR